jgi:hypothetical protein
MHVYVLAANYRHFVYFCRSVGVSPYLGNVVYLRDPHQLLGEIYDNCIFFRYETWAEHPRALELEREIEQLKRKA